MGWARRRRGEAEGAVSDGAVVCEMTGGEEGTAEVVDGEGGEKELEPGKADVVGEGADGLHAAVRGAPADTVALRAHAAVEDIAGTGGAPSAERDEGGGYTTISRGRPSAGTGVLSSTKAIVNDIIRDLLCSRRRGKITEMS